ncbi:Fic family protein [Rhizobium johnstonii]
MNAIHPFREGNGRTQLTFLALLARHVGLPFNAEVLDRERVIEAMIESFAGSSSR